MSRRNRKGQRQGGEAHVRLYRHELDSAAYRTLSTDARALLVELRALFDVKRGDNQVFLSMRDMMQRCNLSQRAAARARDELITCGWIGIAEVGSFRRKVRHATVYTLENEPPNSGNGSVPSKAFMRWQQPEQKNTVVESTTDRYANRLPRPEKSAVTVCKTTIGSPCFDRSTIVESTTQISTTKRSAA
jgi:hypothetical protein